MLFTGAEQGRSKECWKTNTLKLSLLGNKKSGSCYNTISLFGASLAPSPPSWACKNSKWYQWNIVPSLISSVQDSHFASREIKFCLHAFQNHLPGSYERVRVFKGESTFLTIHYTITKDKLGSLSSMPCSEAMTGAYDACAYLQEVPLKFKELRDRDHIYADYPFFRCGIFKQKSLAAQSLGLMCERTTQATSATLLAWMEPSSLFLKGLRIHWTSLWLFLHVCKSEQLSKDDHTTITRILPTAMLRNEFFIWNTSNKHI